MNTVHSLERAHERLGLSEEQAIRFTENAFYRGKSSDQMPKAERLYMESKEVEFGIKSMYYNGVVLIFTTEGRCVTMYLAPQWFGKKRYYEGKKCIRDAKKYQRYSARVA